MFECKENVCLDNVNKSAWGLIPNSGKRFAICAVAVFSLCLPVTNLFEFTEEREMKSSLEHS